MKMPVHCPVCGDILINDYLDLPNGKSRLTKKCLKRLNHSISFRALNDHENVAWISIPWGRTDVIIWYFYSKTCLLNTIDCKDYYIPFFEPDFSDYNKLIEKIKTYLTFS